MYFADIANLHWVSTSFQYMGSTLDTLIKLYLRSLLFSYQFDIYSIEWRRNAGICCKLNQSSVDRGPRNWYYTDRVFSTVYRWPKKGIYIYVLLIWLDTNALKKAVFWYKCRKALRVILYTDKPKEVGYWKMARYVLRGYYSQMITTRCWTIYL